MLSAAKSEVTPSTGGVRSLPDGGAQGSESGFGDSGFFVTFLWEDDGVAPDTKPPVLRISGVELNSLLGEMVGPVLPCAEDEALSPALVPYSRASGSSVVVDGELNSFDVSGTLLEATCSATAAESPSSVEIDIELGSVLAISCR